MYENYPLSKNESLRTGLSIFTIKKKGLALKEKLSAFSQNQHQ